MNPHPQSEVTTPTVCSRCLYDSTIRNIAFDADGVCSYCRMTEDLERQYPAGEQGQAALDAICNKIRHEGRGKPYDVVVGVSGGCDSSYLLHLAVQQGLRPLAVHFDNTWNSTIAQENIERVVKKLGVDYETHVVDNREYNDILRAFMLSGVPDIETPTDIGLAGTMYRACVKYGVRYQWNGHNFRTEGVSPLGWIYMDGRYIRSVVKAHGNYGQHRMRTFPNMSLFDMLHWMAARRIKQIRPLWHLDLNKEAIKRMLAREYGWQWYGGHHLENRFTAFYHSYFLPKRFGIDGRKLGHCALVRGGQITREEAAQQLAVPAELDPAVLKLVKQRLKFSDAEFDAVMTQPRKTFRDFKTYKQTFERLRPLFWLLSRYDLVPKSFYIKYTAKDGL